jgi:hypothetical protein
MHTPVSQVEVEYAVTQDSLMYFVSVAGRLNPDVLTGVTEHEAMYLKPLGFKGQPVTVPAAALLATRMYPWRYPRDVIREAP